MNASGGTLINHLKRGIATLDADQFVRTGVSARLRVAVIGQRAGAGGAQRIDPAGFQVGVAQQ